MILKVLSLLVLARWSRGTESFTQAEKSKGLATWITPSSHWLITC
jgi:hypothetical protein